jgi:hypothetical protein
MRIENNSTKVLPGQVAGREDTNCFRLKKNNQPPLPDTLIEEQEETRTGRCAMKTGIGFAGLILLFAPITLAKDPPDYGKGLLLSMDSASCGYAEKDAKTITGQIIGTDSAHKNTKELLCQEYVMQAEHITYRIRPKDDKHPALLPIGEAVQYRIHKDKMYLRVAEGDGKEREYLVLSMKLREDPKQARLNQ